MRPLVPAGVLLLAALAGPPTIDGSPAAARSAPTCAGVRATIVGTSGSDVITGTPRRDVVVAGAGDDVVRGRGGDDLVCGGRGRDLLWGGPGDDRLLGGLDRVAVTDEGSSERTGDVLRGGPGDDRLVGGRDTRSADVTSPDTIGWDEAASGVRVDLARGVATGEGRDSFEPRWTAFETSSHDDVVTGGDRGERISTGLGGDEVRAGGGPDVVHPDPASGPGGGADLVLGGPGDDVVESGSGRDHVVGGPGDDLLFDLAAAPDVLEGGDGRDVVGDQLTTTPGTRVVGGPGRDRLVLFGNLVNPTAEPATASMDLATGRVAFDAGTPSTFTAEQVEWLDLMTYGFVWTVRGTNGPDRVDGSGSSGTTFTALGGDDLFGGSASDDTFRGGPGTDRNLGMGVGTNTCVSVEVDVDSTCGP